MHAALTALPIVLLASLALARPASAVDDAKSDEWKAKVKAISAKVEELRGLPFEREVEVGVKSEPELLDFLKKTIEKEMPDAKLRSLQRAYAKMGLVPKDLDLKKTILDLLTSQIGGFYDPETKALNLIDRSGNKDGKKNPTAELMEAGLRMLGLSQDDLVTSHELTHALQDQHFNLLKLQRGLEDNDDRSTAMKCLIEGDATILMMDFLADKAPMLKKMLRGKDMGGMGMPVDPEMKNVPPILLEPLIYPYMGGASLVQAAIKKGGWKAVDALYKDLPLSSEQVLHLEKFFDDRDEPTFVGFSDVRGLAPRGAKLLECNVLGELGTRVLFSGFLPKGEANAAAAGWDGDRFAAYEQGDRVFFFWFTTWDDASEAQEFAQAYAKLLAKKYGLKGDVAGADTPFVFDFDKDGECGRLEVRGTDAVVVEGLTGEECVRLADRLFREAKKTSPAREAAAPAPGPEDEGEEGGAEIRGQGFTVVPPAGWKVKREKKFGRLVMRPPRGRARLEFGTIDLPRPMGPEEIGEEIKKELPSKLTGFRLEEADLKTEGDVTAYLLLFDADDPDTKAPFRYAMGVRTRGTKAVIFTFLAPADVFKKGEELEKSEEAVKSFRWK
jgi:hypothetical protein